MIEQFIDLLTKEKEAPLISFLQSLTDDQKKKLVPGIKKLTKEYNEFGKIDSDTWGNLKGTNVQRNFLQLTAFVCYNKLDYEKTPFSLWLLDKTHLNKIIDWYCPTWFNDFVNKQVDLEYVPIYISYGWMLELNQRGFISPTPQLLAKLMSRVIFENDEKNKWHFRPEKLLEYKITLKEHIWYLFEWESNLHYSDRFLSFEKGIDRENFGWVYIFKKYSQEGLIDRNRLQKAALLAANRNFNKILSGWFVELFVELGPTKTEIIQLQDELLSVLSSAHSKVVNTSLQLLKGINSEKEFNISSFLDAAPMLLASNTKATIILTLTILEKIAQKNPESHEQIVTQIFQCFLHSDEVIQTKAAKLIGQYGNSRSPATRNEMTVFYPMMLSNSRQLLTSFYEEAGQMESISLGDPKKREEELEAYRPQTIEFPANLDDLFFLASQAFDNNEPWHIDLLPAALIQFQAELKENDYQKFEPAFQRAFSLVNFEYRAGQGNLDNLLAYFFIDYGAYLISRFPAFSKSIEQIYRKHDKIVDGRRTSFTVMPPTGSYTKRWEIRNKTGLYEPYKQLLLASLEKIRENDILPLLSVPTHAPGWIYPDKLIDRLQKYQQYSKKINEMDLQVAISRCFFHDIVKNVQRAKKELVGEIAELVIFLLDDNVTPREPFYNKAGWMVASLTKKEKKQWPEFSSFSYTKQLFNNYTGQLRWQPTVEAYMARRYDPEKGKSVTEAAIRTVLNISKSTAQGEKTGLKKLFSSFFLAPPKEDSPMLYQFLNFTPEYMDVQENDMRRFLSLTPNNPEPLVADTLINCLRLANFLSENDKKLVTAVLQTLHELRSEPGEMTKLFIGTCMLSSDKTVVNIAGEIWIQWVSANAINSAELGKIIGLHESIEYAPLKRFTDLAVQSLMRISTAHNKQLEILVEHLLLELPDIPIKNLKKLLEIYQELIALNRTSELAPAIINKLEAWEKNAGLRKLAGSLISNNK